MVTVTTGPPRLPQHPLPPTSSAVTACKIEPVEIQPQQQQPRTVVALKKREIMMTKDLQNEMKIKEDSIPSSDVVVRILHSLGNPFIILVIYLDLHLCCRYLFLHS